MALYIKIVDDKGNPDAVSSLADVIADEVIKRGVGFFKGEEHVAKDIRDAVHSLIRKGHVAVQNPILKTCPVCSKTVSIIHTRADGSQVCTFCK